jgi:hypothetical protein
MTSLVQNTDLPFPRRETPELCVHLAPNRGRGECRVPVAPAASCAHGELSMHTSIHSEFAEIARHPHAMVYGLYRALLGDRALLPPSPAKVAFHKLDASVEASGPHDFAVREQCSRLQHHPRPPHPAPRP